MIKLFLFLYVLPAILVLVQGKILEQLTLRRLSFSKGELLISIFTPVWNLYIAYTLAMYIHKAGITIRPNIQVEFFPSIQLLPNIQYVFNSGWIISFPFFGVITISPKEVE